MSPLSTVQFYFGQGVGTVVSGTTLRGLIRLNDTLLLGPDPLGAFLSITVKSIHRKRMPVKEVRGGQTASFALKKVCGVGSKINGIKYLGAKLNLSLPAFLNKTLPATISNF